MRRVLFLILFIAAISGCRAQFPIYNAVTLTPSTRQIVQSSSTPVKSLTPESTILPILFSTPAKTVIPESTPAPADIQKKIEQLMQTNGNCSFPCFWGLDPEKTSQAELENLLSQLGKNGFIYQDGDHIYESTTLPFNKLGGVYLQADIQNNVVRNVKSTLDGLWNPEITPNDWSAYNLNSVLKTYGSPDDIEIYLDLPYNSVLYGIRLIYKNLDTIILFSGSAKDQKTSDGLVKICPDTSEISSVILWLGKNPINNGVPNGIPLSNATSLSVDKFTKLYRQDSQSACMTLHIDVFSGGTIK
jgi:hypothetical protein